MSLFDLHPARRAATLLPIALAVQSVFANTDDFITLEESVVSASGYEQDVRDAPASISVVSGETLASQPVTDIGEAIQDVPGVEVEQTKMGDTRFASVDLNRNTH